MSTIFPIPANGRGARVSACAGLNRTDNVVGSILALLENPDTAIVGDWWTGVGGTPRPVLLPGAKKSHLGCLVRFELPMGF